MKKGMNALFCNCCGVVIYRTTYDRVYVNGSDFWPKGQILKVKLIISNEKCIKFQEKIKFLQQQKIFWGQILNFNFLVFFLQFSNFCKKELI